MKHRTKTYYSLLGNISISKKIVLFRLFTCIYYKYSNRYPAWLKNDSYSNWWSHKNFTYIKWVSYITNKVVGSLKCVLFIIMLFEVYI